MPTGVDQERHRAIVFVVDDDASVRESLSSLLRAFGWDVKTFATAAEFLQQSWPQTPACLVLDVRMPDIGGLEVQRMLVDRGNRRPIIFMTAHGDIATTVRAMKSGAVEFLAKPFGRDELLSAIEQALLRDAAQQHDRIRDAERRQRIASLSPRERQVMQLIVAGLLNKQVAARLNITETTVKVHRRRVMEKTAARSLADLVRMVDRASPPTDAPYFDRS